MEIIRLTHPHNLKQIELPEMVLALGYFDGVHKGHKKVIQTAKEKAKEFNLKSGVMTFDPHPSVVLRKNSKPIQLLTPVQKKIHLIQELSVDYIFVVQFTEDFADLLPQQFIDQYIINLNVKHVVAGFDFTYGKLGKGTMETLPFHSRDFFNHTIVEKQTDHDRKISSTLIRELIQSGNVEYAHQLLGRPHGSTGTVIHGEKRGSKIGFPTANIFVNKDYILPPTGVYAVKVQIEGESYNGVCNIGYKPTFHQEKSAQPSIEVHIFDFNSQIYDLEIEFSWMKRIRSEKRFNSIDNLVKQIKRDKKEAYDYLRNI
ncbi:bifunctional riboflavin kinase/FAD synthetase [Bacillus carboniphilus]|uniref:Riboflavin biosynthesis protein n=1 Tax=Bacillus carboniphilus TaxID=86663 RepID=A0ABY9K0S8_9BACI|nr:bifunctional riboflavin kinase/FAD synthetase [Bacillus carboniphilus]WLR43501.1 bifunctional riboflavin kinase/FAD synthetase [Bacillus carboniphilus]